MVSKGPFVLRTSYLVLLQFIFISQKVNAQDTTRNGIRGGTVRVVASDSLKKANTYALLIGINYSKRTHFEPLYYAVSDAQLFKSFLMEGAFLDTVPEDNIHIIEDKKATGAELAYAFKALNDSAKEGDNVIIYFAGHGIFTGASLGYLLAYDAPDVADPMLIGFQPGVISIYQLKEALISVLKRKKVSVYLITDACRSDDMPKTSPDESQNVMEISRGEIQFSSCSKDQSSFEDKKWGGGHGVFTYYLMKGLSGFADDEGFTDGKVSFYELGAYVTKYVMNDTRDLVSNKARQKPYIHIPNTATQEQTIALANKPKLREQFKEGNLLATVKRSMNADTSDLMKQFQYALEKKIFFPEEKNNAYVLLQQLKQTRGTREFEEAQQDYIIQLLNDAQIRVNKYFEGVDTIYSMKFFEVGAREFTMALNLMSKDHPLYKIYDINRLFMDAHRYWGNYSKYELAGAKLDSAIAQDPTLAYLYNAKGLLLSANGRYADALPWFDKAHALKPNWWFPIYDKAKCLFEMHEYDKAKKIFYENMHTRDSIAWFNEFAGIHKKMRQYDSARYYYLRTLKSSPDNLVYILQYADLFRTISKFDSALLMYNKALAKDPENLAIQKNIGYTYILMHKYEEANNIYRKIIQTDSLDHNNWAYLGFLYFYKEDYEMAIVHFQKALTLDPVNRVIMEMLGSCYANQSDIVKAKKTYLDLLSIDSLRKDSWLNLGDLYYDHDDFHLSLDYYKKALALDRGSSETLRKLASNYTALARYDSAEFFFQEAIASDPRDPYIWNLLGNHYYALKQFDSAAYCYRQSLRVEPTFGTGFLNLGFTAKERNKKPSLDSAIYFFKKATITDPFDTRAAVELSVIYRQKKQPALGNRYIRAAMQYFPQKKELVEELLDNYFEQGKYDSVYYYQTRLLPPGNEFTGYEDWLYFKDDKSQMKYYRTLLKKTNKFDSILFIRLGDYYYNKVKTDSALYFYKKFDERFKSDNQLKEKMGELYEKKGNGDQAIKFYQDELKKDPMSAFANYKLGRIEQDRKKNNDKAFEHYQKLLNQGGKVKSNSWDFGAGETDISFDGYWDAKKFTLDYLYSHKRWQEYADVQKTLLNRILKFAKEPGLFKDLINGYQLLRQDDSVAIYSAIRDQLVADEPVSLYDKADSSHKLGHFKEALSLYQSSYNLQLNIKKYFSNYQLDPRAPGNIAYCQLRLGNPDSALHYLRQIKTDTTHRSTYMDFESYHAWTGYYAYLKDEANALKYADKLFDVMRLPVYAEIRENWYARLLEWNVMADFLRSESTKILLVKYHLDPFTIR